MTTASEDTVEQGLDGSGEQEKRRLRFYQAAKLLKLSAEYNSKHRAKM